MAKLRGSDRDLSYIKEVTAGTTPATPAMKLMRTTGDTFQLSRDSFTSAELTADRGISDMKLGNKQTAGTINFELSYENFEDFMAGVLMSDTEFTVLTGSEIKNGKTMYSYSIEKGFPTGGHYEVYRGMVPNTFNLTLQSNAQVTGSLEFIGRTYEQGVATIANSVIDPRQGGLFDSYTGSLKEGGTTVGFVSSANITLTNGLNPLFALFNDSVTDIIDGRCNVTGSISIYFENATMYNKFANETESSLEFTLLDNLGNGYTFLIPRIKYSSVDMPVNGEGVIMVNMPFQALQDSATDTTIKITKIVV